MGRLTPFGLIAVSAMLIFYALEDRSHWFVLASAVVVDLLQPMVSGCGHSVLSRRVGPWWLFIAGGCARIDRSSAATSILSAK